MESPRSSPLSTLIMILPLIVVPGLAILRPADHNNGFVSEDLNAAAQGVDFSEFEPNGRPGDRFARGANDNFSRLLDGPATRPRAGGSRLEDPMARLDAPLAEDWQSPSRSNIARDSNASDGAMPPRVGMPDSASRPHAVLLEDLRTAGVTRTMWFRPGQSGDVGFIAFLPGSGQMVSYRFEAIAASESDAIRDVVRQVRQWQHQQPSASSSGN